MEVSDAELNAVLRKLGHESFRPGQERVNRDVLKGRDVLAVLSSGSGQSPIPTYAS